MGTSLSTPRSLKSGTFAFVDMFFFLPVGVCSHVDESWERYLLPWSCILYNSKVCEFKEVKEEAREDDLV